MPVTSQGRRLGRLGVAAAVVAAAAGPAGAQSASSTLSAFSHGYGPGLSGFAAPVDVSTHAAGSGVAFTDGVLQAPTGSLFANLQALDVSPSPPAGVETPTWTPSGDGAGALPAASSTSTPAQTSSAPLVLNGKVNLDGG